MGRGVPPRGRVLLSPSRSAGTPRDGSRTARCGGATPCWVVVEKRKAMSRGACCTKRRDTTRFRAVFWVSPYPCLPAYTLMYGPNHSPKGLFRAPKWATHRVGAGQPMAWQPCLFPGLQRGVDTPVRTRAYRGRRLRVDGPAARGVAPEVVARFTEPAARGCTASRPSAAAPAARAGRCCWRRWVRDARVATEGSLSFPPLDAGGLNRSSMGT